MSATLRLFRIEAQRSLALWFVPVVLAVTWYAGRESHATDMTLWSKTSAQVGQALIALAPLMGGLSAGSPAAASGAGSRTCSRRRRGRRRTAICWALRRLQYGRYWPT